MFLREVGKRPSASAFGYGRSPVDVGQKAYFFLPEGISLPLLWLWVRRRNPQPSPGDRVDNGVCAIDRKVEGGRSYDCVIGATRGRHVNFPKMAKSAAFNVRIEVMFALRKVPAINVSSRRFRPNCGLIDARPSQQKTRIQQTHLAISAQRRMRSTKSGRVPGLAALLKGLRSKSKVLSLLA